MISCVYCQYDLAFILLLVTTLIRFTKRKVIPTSSNEGLHKKANTNISVHMIDALNQGVHCLLGVLL